ncbi:MAG: hypothetical protein RSD49_20645 [Hafnia sp.]
MKKKAKSRVGNIVISLTERRVLGDEKPYSEVVFDVIGRDICYSINYPLNDTWEKIQERYPTPLDYLSLLSLPELETITARDIGEFELNGFEALYSKKSIKAFHKLVAPYIESDERYMSKVFYEELDPQRLQDTLKKSQ